MLLHRSRFDQSVPSPPQPMSANPLTGICYHTFLSALFCVFLGCQAKELSSRSLRGIFGQDVVNNAVYASCSVDDASRLETGVNQGSPLSRKVRTTLSLEKSLHTE